MNVQQCQADREKVCTTRRKISQNCKAVCTKNGLNTSGHRAVDTFSVSCTVYGCIIDDHAH